MGQLSRGNSQIVLLGLLAACCGGVWNGLLSFGVGQEDGWQFMNIAVMTMYFTFAAFLLIAPALLNALGHRAWLCLGGLSYALFMAAPFVSVFKHKDNTLAAKKFRSLCIVAGAILGIGSAGFWAAITDSLAHYMQPRSKQGYIIPFIGLIYGGSIVASIIGLSINVTRDNYTDFRRSTYYTFIGISGVAALAVWLFIASPEKVTRRDGTIIRPNTTSLSLSETFDNLGKCLTGRTALLLPLFLVSQWFYPYHFNYNIGLIFDTPGRGICALVYWVSSAVAALIMSLMISRVRIAPKRRAAIMWAISLLFFAISWGLMLSIQFSTDGLYNALDKDRLSLGHQANRIRYDESRDATLPAVANAFNGLATGSLQVLCVYLLVASVAEQKGRHVTSNDSGMLIAKATLYKIVQALGAGIAWGLDIHKTIKYRAQIWVGIAGWFMAMGLSFAYIRGLRIREADDLDKDVGSLVLSSPVDAPGGVSRGSRRENELVDV